MLRYIFLSVFALLLLTACGGNDLEQLKKYKNWCNGCDLSGVDLTGVNLRGAEIAWADLSGANLSGADLSEAYLTETDLTGANLTDANLEEANLGEANLTDANLTGADLRGAKLYGVIGPDFTGALNVPANALAITHSAIGAYEDGPDVQNFQVLKLFLVIFISFGAWVFLTVSLTRMGSSRIDLRRTREGLTSYTANLGCIEYVLVFVGCFAVVAGYCYWPEISSLIGL